MSKTPMMRKCYEDQLKINKSDFGFKSILKLKINSLGNVQSSHVEVKERANDKQVLATSNCVNGILKSIKFPKSFGKGFTEVNQPIGFLPEPK
jgi:hypothetical protein